MEKEKVSKAVGLAYEVMKELEISSLAKAGLEAGYQSSSTSDVFLSAVAGLAGAILIADKKA